MGTEVKGERSEGAKRQPLDRMTRPDAKRAWAANCGPVNCAWVDGWVGELPGTMACFGLAGGAGPAGDGSGRADANVQASGQAPDRGGADPASRLRTLPHAGETLGAKIPHATTEVVVLGGRHPRSALGRWCSVQTTTLASMARCPIARATEMRWWPSWTK
jgi:hypothetical protein